MSERIFSDLGAEAAQAERRARAQSQDSAPRHDPFGAGESLVRQEEQAIAATKKLQARQSPPGTFKIPPLLEQRRLQHVIPDGAFRRAPIWDWCFIYQVAREDISLGDTFGDTSILKPAARKEYERNESPRGILIGAGLGAMDTLASHGIHIGDIVFMIRNAPWAIQVDVLDGQALYMYCLRDADLVAGEDLQKRLQSGVLKLERVVEEKDGQKFTRHRYVQEDGTPMDPMSPWIPDDL